MSSLSSELRGVIEKRLKVAGAQEILAIASTLCAQENGSAAKASIVTTSEAAAGATKGGRFFEYTDSVFDKTTGLLWTKANVGSKPMNWKDAKASAEAVRIGDATDWRLPTIQELLTLVDYDRHDPAIDPVFKCDSDWYWTSTVPAASPSDCAWIVSFYNGYSGWGNQSSECPVRAVRAGQLIGTLG